MGVEHCEEGVNCFKDAPCDRAVHAEVNCIAFAAKEGISTEGSILYCTLSPCLNCVKLLINAGIESVIYLNQYRDFGGLYLLEEMDIPIISLEELENNAQHKLLAI